MRIWACILLIVIIPKLCYTQSNFKVGGYVSDAFNGLPLSGASVVFYRTVDSIKFASTITDRNGYFTIDSTIQKSIFVRVSFLGYETQEMKMDFRKEKNVNIYYFKLVRASLNISEIEIVQSKSPIVIRGDTLQFDASFYKINDDDMLTALLAKMPGFGISTDGIITYNGEPIKKILIDGKLYFGNDIGIALKNLSADLIDKVNLINRYSDESILDGSNISSKEKIINLTIKESKRNKIVGQISGGGGFDEKYVGKINLNKFGSKSQTSIIGGIDNINSNGTVGTNANVSEYNFGVNFSSNISRRVALNSNYLFDKWTRNSIQTVERRTFLQDSLLYFKQLQNTNERMVSSKLNIKVDYNIDSSSSLNFESSLTQAANYGEFNSNDLYSSENNFISSGRLSGKNSTLIPSISETLSYSKEFKKMNRRLTISSFFRSLKNSGENLNVSDILYESPVDSQTHFNQISEMKNLSTLTRISFIYVEPISTSTNLFVNGGYIYEKYPSSKTTYDYDYTSEKYIVPNDSLSQDLVNRTKSGFVNFILRGDYKKLSFNVTTRIISLSMLPDFKNLAEQKPKSIRLILPSTYFEYRFSKSKILYLKYYTNSILPTFNQINPIPDNSAPTIRRVGNPNIKAGIAHNFQLGFNKILTRSYGLSAIFSGAVIKNQILEQSVIREASQFIYPINANGTYQFGMNINNSVSLMNKLLIDASSSVSFSKNIYQVSDINSLNINYSVAQSLKSSYSISNKLNMNFGGSVSFSKISYPNQSIATIRLSSYDINFGGSIYLPKGFLFGSTFATNAISNNGSVIRYNQLNIDLSKKMKERFIFKIQGMDLLGSKIYISRQIGINYIEDVKTTTLGRMMLFSLTYHFK